MRKTKGILFFVVSLAPVSAFADDPRERDEDISATTLSVEMHQENGAWHYAYTVGAPATNKGTVQFLNVDLSCEREVTEWETFDPSRHVENGFDDYSDHAATTPAAIAAAWGQAYDFGLTRRNDAMFALDLEPGNVANGLVLISPYGPKLRAYWLRPDFMVSEQWDYPEDAEEQPDIPTADDFTVTGMIHGPACPGDETEDPEPDLFYGSISPWQTGEANALLRYSSPLRDRFPRPEGDELVIHVYYAENIDASSFKVEPARNGIRRLFNPEAGTDEEVRIPLGKGFSKLKLSVSAAGGEKGSSRKGLDRDVDVFEFREQQAEVTKNGAGKR